MKNKITLLILASVLGLIALSSIQAYLISNTYELKKKVFIKETDVALEVLGKVKDLDSISNGLSYAVEKFKTHGLAGHVTLMKGERSKVATLASKIL